MPMHRLLVAVTFVALLSAVVVCGAPVTVSASREVECAVCRTAVTHVWDRATTVLAHCQVVKGPERDERCDFHLLHPWAIDQMVWGVCDALVAEYKVPAEGRFRLVKLQEAVQHVYEEASMIRDVCADVFHGRDQGGAEEVGSKFQSLLEMSGGMPTADAVRTLTEQLCSTTCQALAEDEAAMRIEIPVPDALPEFPVYDDDDGEF